MGYELEPLPYAYDALEPFIDAQTMKLHHTKHHQAYIDKVNAALRGTPWDNKPIEEVLQQLDKLPEEIRRTVRNNGGGHYNHSLFWKILGKNDGKEPEGALKEAIDKSFGDFATFKQQVIQAGLHVFGSGWVWVLVNKEGKLVISTTSNQDSPIMDGQEPLLGVDVWEHAYYLTYQNRRQEYLENIFHVLNWSAITERFAQLLKQ